MSKETPQQLADRLKFEYDASQNMDGILYQDENRDFGSENDCTTKKALEHEQKIDSNDKPDIPTPSVPFWMNIKRK